MNYLAVLTGMKWSSYLALEKAPRDTVVDLRASQCSTSAPTPSSTDTISIITRVDGRGWTLNP